MADTGVVHDLYFVLRRQSMTRLYDFVGIAFFSVDTLKHMIVCWDAWVLMSLCQIIDYCFEHSCLNIHAMIRLHDQDYAR